MTDERRADSKEKEICRGEERLDETARRPLQLLGASDVYDYDGSGGGDGPTSAGWLATLLPPRVVVASQ